MDLQDHRNKTSKQLSGGNKRKLAVAIAFIGDPKIVFLDEPSTGMDPIIRRKMWNLIASMKKNRAIILTTHSMEEAGKFSLSLCFFRNIDRTLHRCSLRANWNCCCGFFTLSRYFATLEKLIRICLSHFSQNQTRKYSISDRVNFQYYFYEV